MNLSETVLVIPPNDAEAILISKIAEAMKLPLLLSKQTHGASLDKGKDVPAIVKKHGYKRVVVVEMPGPKAEAKLRSLGVELVIIDHHNYTGLDRAVNPKTGKLLPSSLEQFLKLFKLTDAKLKALGFDPKLVLGVGIVDKGYIWALKDEGYTKAQMEKVMIYRDQLIAPLLNPATEARKQRATLSAWEKRKVWKGFLVIESEADVQLRPRISELVARQIGKPTAMIIVEHKRRLIYVQESNYAMILFNTFGGFTFGLNRNWGYRNEEGKKHIGIKDVKRVLEEAGAT